jgi:hypothetical protein
MNIKNFRDDLKKSMEFKINTNAESIDYRAYLPQKQKKPILSFRYLSIFATLVILGILTFFSYHPTSTLSLEINPEIKLELNIFNRIVSVNAYNSDGLAMVEELDLKYKKINSAIDMIYEYSEANNLLHNDNLYILIGVESNEKKTVELQKKIAAIETENIVSIVIPLYNQVAPSSSNIPTASAPEAGFDSNIAPNYSIPDFILNKEAFYFTEDLSDARNRLINYIIQTNDEYTTSEDLMYLINLPLWALMELYNN